MHQETQIRWVISKESDKQKIGGQSKKLAKLFRIG